MIDYNDAEKALEFLKSTDKEAARLRARAGALDDFKKPALAMMFNSYTEGSAAANLKKAEGSMDYKNHLENLRQANQEWYEMQNKRNSAERQVEMWRSVNSNQRKGNI